MESKKFTIKQLTVLFVFAIVGLFGQQVIAQTCFAPNGCNPTPGFPNPPAALTNCGAASFTETFDNGFGVFTEDSPPGPNTTGANDLTVSTAGDTPSGGTGPETTAGCNGGTNDGEFIFLESSFAQPGETHCMTATIPIPNNPPTTVLSFWYYMFGGNQGTLEIFVNGTSSFSISGQQQTANCQAWLQGVIDVSSFAGTSPSVRICMSEGTGSSTFQGDISIDHVQVFSCDAIQPCDLTCAAAPIEVDNDPGQCGAMVDPSPTVAGAGCTAPLLNDYNGTDNALDFYPVGTTTVTFSTIDGLGNPVSCSVDVTVNDTEAPALTGCDPVTVNLKATECCEFIDFDVTAVDNCSMGGNEPGSLSTTFTNGNGASGNMFDVQNISNNPVVLTGMFEGNIETFGGPPDISVYYTTTATTYVGNETNAAAWTLIGTADNVISVGQNQPTPYDVGGTLTLMPGQSVGLFVVDNTSSIDYTNGSTVVDDGVLQITAGNGRGLNATNPFAGFVFADRIWNGTIFYEVQAQLDVVQTDATGLFPGDCFPIGETILEFQVTDPGGFVATCQKVITVNPFTPTSITMACNDVINVTLDTLCSATITPDMVLEGGNYGCYDDYVVNLFYDAALTQPVPSSPVLTSAEQGLTIYTQVVDPFIGLTCWGTIIVEDKTDPTLACDCEQGGTPVTSYDGDLLGAGITTFNRPTGFPGCTPNATNNNFEAFTFTVSVSGSYTFTIPNNIGPNFDFALYAGGFDPAQPCNNLIAYDDASVPASSEPTITINLNVGTTYTLVTLNRFTGAGAGAYTVFITNGAGDVLARDANCIVKCFDDLSNLPTPIASDACGIASLTSVDQTVDGGNCGTSTLFRTWTATDVGGNTVTCVQEFLIQPGTLADVTAPTNFDGIDGRSTLLCENRCGDAAELADTRFCGPSDIYWAVIPDGSPYAGHPSPDASKNWGCGLVKCFGTGRPGEGSTCGNIQSTFADTRINICTSGPSEGCYKILRNWTVLDWCTGEVAFFNQVIKVEDNEGPQIADVADIAISVDVWRCEAEWLATEPWLMDNCSSEPLSYSVSSTGGTVQALPDGRYRILDLVPGQYQVTYSASDCCGNVTDSTITLTVIDDVAPVAVCDAHTVVSISRTTNIQDDNLGLTKIFATTFDDGSFDNCSDVVWFKAIRMDEYDSNGNGKFPETVRDGDWASIDCDAANGDDDLRTRPSYYQGPQSYFDDHVKFCCADIAVGPIMVVFRVYDVDPEPYTFGRVFPQLVPSDEDPDDYNGVLPEAQDVGGPLYGHYDDCMVEVSVQDKLPPYVVAPPSLTVTCDYWFPFDADNPQDYTDELDALFGKVIEGSADPADRDSIVVTDRVCPAHPRFAEYAPANPADDQCYDDKYDIFWGYDGYVLDNCSIELEQTIIPDLHCGRGDIIRRWRAGDDAGNWSNTATQVITIIDCKEFFVPTVCWRFTQKDIGECVRLSADEYKIQLIEWPCDVEVNRCQTAGLDAFLPDNLPIPFDQDRRPRYDDDNCNLLGATYTDRTFTFVDNACVKIFRDWTVIDWCLYEDGVTPYQWEWTQVIKLLNTEGPVFDDCEDREFCGFGDPAFPNNNQCVGEVVLEPGITDDCSDLATIRTDYKIDAFNDGTYDILGYSDNHPVNPFGIGANATVYPATSPNANGKYPVGEHRILWTAEDGCGNITTCEYRFTVQDCKPPTPYCRNGVSTIPMPIDAGGYVDIWASDYNIGSYDNCTAQGDLIYSFSDDPTDLARRFTCADAPGLFNLTVYVWDLGLDGLPRNYATCGVTIQLEDCANQTTYSVAGAIETEAGIEASNVTVGVSGGTSTDMTTDNSGTYGFNLPASNNYVVAPAKDLNHRNGVSTFDLVLISKHITGQQSLNSPFKMIAADVNNTGSITTFDIIELRKLILYINTEFPDNTSWRFIPSAFNFVDASNPFASTFPEAYDINDLSTNMNNADFVAIKVGDVNESAQANNLTVPGQTRSAGELNFNVQDQLLNAGQTVTVDFTAADFANILGYQFTLNYSNAVQVTEVQGGVLAGLTEGNFGKLSNAITTSWNAAKAANLSSDDVVFSITLTANANVKLSDVLSISSEYTTAEAYSAAGLLNVALNFNTEASAEFALYQNQPNPFTANTVIGFNLPQTGTATLSIYDVAGKVLKVVEGEYSKGYNEVTVERSDLRGAGVLYYSLETQNESATKKMIIID